MAWGPGGYGFLFSVPGQVQGLGQLEGRFVEGPAGDRGPEIEDGDVGAAVGVEALEDVLAQMGGEGALGIVGRAVDRAGAAPLLATAAQAAEQSQVFEDLLHGDLLTQESEINFGACAGFGRSWRVDRRRRGG